MRTLLTRGAALAVVGVLALVLVPRVLADEEPFRLAADFRDTTGIYVGNEVEYLGVPVGEITEIEARGTSMRVHMELDGDLELPAGAGAMILQASLVTDRYVEVGPAYTGGPTLPDGTVLPMERTRAPATVDEVTSSLSELVDALDRPTPDGQDVGDLLSATADTLDGNGEVFREALVAGEQALRTFTGSAEDVAAVTDDLEQLVDALSRRDRTIRRFAHDVDLTSQVVADQRASLTATLESLGELSTLTTTFVRRNREVVTEDLRRALRVARTVGERQDQLAEAFDTMPTLAENLTRAYDFDRQRLRVQYSTLTGPFSAVWRSKTCGTYLPTSLCDQLFSVDGAGVLDPVFALLYALVPGGIP